MAHERSTRSPEVSVICYPFFPTKRTGRGVDRYCFELIENLSASFRELTVRVVEQGSSEGALVSVTKLARLARDLLAIESRAYHAVSPPAAAAAILLGKQRVIVTIHDLVPFQVKNYSTGLKFAYVRFCIKICVARAHAIIVPFRVTKDELVAQHGALESKVHVVNYGLDHSVYHPLPGVERNPRRILYIGEVSRAKGVDVLIRAFAIVKKSVPDAELLIGGKTNKDQPHLEELSRSLGVDGIEFKGFIPEAELASYYASAAVMVFPSRYGFGLSSLEAMACGTPVIVAATLDAPEFIADAGLLVKPGDEEDLANNMLRLLQDPALRAEFGRRGVARAAEYSWAAMAANTAEVYRAALI